MHLRFAAALALAGLLINCAAPSPSTPDTSAESPAEHLERDLGGPDALLDFLSTNSEADIRAVLSEYGIGYEVHDVSVVPKYIGDCPQFFPSSDRNTWHAFDGEHYYVDGSGRPSIAYKYMPPISTAPRNDSCQASVGQWGDAASSNDFDGGHLIASQLGGWGKRANLVPQDLNFNRGNWAQIENKMAQCGGLPSGRLMYRASAGYPNGSTLIPSTIGLLIQDVVQGDSISKTFQNVDYGGSNGTTYRTQVVSFLDAQGCN
jgi:hypothetical protein